MLAMVTFSVAANAYFGRATWVLDPGYSDGAHADGAYAEAHMGSACIFTWGDGVWKRTMLPLVTILLVASLFFRQET